MDVSSGASEYKDVLFSRAKELRDQMHNLFPDEPAAAVLPADRLNGGTSPALEDEKAGHFGKVHKEELEKRKALQRLNLDERFDSNFNMLSDVLLVDTLRSTPVSPLLSAAEPFLKSSSEAGVPPREAGRDNVSERGSHDMHREAPPKSPRAVTVEAVDSSAGSHVHEAHKRAPASASAAPAEEAASPAQQKDLNDLQARLRMMERENAILKAQLKRQAKDVEASVGKTSLVMEKMRQVRNGHRPLEEMYEKQMLVNVDGLQRDLQFYEKEREYLYSKVFGCDIDMKEREAAHEDPAAARKQKAVKDDRHEAEKKMLLKTTTKLTRQLFMIRRSKGQLRAVIQKDEVHKMAQCDVDAALVYQKEKKKRAPRRSANRASHSPKRDSDVERVEFDDVAESDDEEPPPEVLTPAKPVGEWIHFQETDPHYEEIARALINSQPPIGKPIQSLVIAAGAAIANIERVREGSMESLRKYLSHNLAATADTFRKTHNEIAEERQKFAKKIKTCTKELRRATERKVTATAETQTATEVLNLSDLPYRGKGGKRLSRRELSQVGADPGTRCAACCGLVHKSYETDTDGSDSEAPEELLPPGVRLRKRAKSSAPSTTPPPPESIPTPREPEIPEELLEEMVMARVKALQDEQAAELEAELAELKQSAKDSDQDDDVVVKDQPRTKAEKLEVFIRNKNKQMENHAMSLHHTIFRTLRKMAADLQVPDQYVPRPKAEKRDSNSVTSKFEHLVCLLAEDEKALKKWGDIIAQANLNALGKLRNNLKEAQLEEEMKRMVRSPADSDLEGSTARMRPTGPRKRTHKVSALGRGPDFTDTDCETEVQPKSPAIPASAVASPTPSSPASPAVAPLPVPITDTSPKSKMLRMMQNVKQQVKSDKILFNLSASEGAGEGGGKDPQAEGGDGAGEPRPRSFPLYRERQERRRRFRDFCNSLEGSSFNEFCGFFVDYCYSVLGSLTNLRNLIDTNEKRRAPSPERQIVTSPVEPAKVVVKCAQCGRPLASTPYCSKTGVPHFKPLKATSRDGWSNTVPVPMVDVWTSYNYTTPTATVSTTTASGMCEAVNVAVAVSKARTLFSTKLRAKRARTPPKQAVAVEAAVSDSVAAPHTEGARTEGGTERAEGVEVAEASALPAEVPPPSPPPREPPSPPPPPPPPPSPPPSAPLPPAPCVEEQAAPPPPEIPTPVARQPPAAPPVQELTVSVETRSADPLPAKHPAPSPLQGKQQDSPQAQPQAQVPLGLDGVSVSPRVSRGAKSNVPALDTAGGKDLGPLMGIVGAAPTSTAPQKGTVPDKQKTPLQAGRASPLPSPRPGVLNQHLLVESLGDVPKETPQQPVMMHKSHAATPKGHMGSSIFKGAKGEFQPLVATGVPGKPKQTPQQAHQQTHQQPQDRSGPGQRGPGALPHAMKVEGRRGDAEFSAMQVVSKKPASKERQPRILEGHSWQQPQQPQQLQQQKPQQQPGSAMRVAPSPAPEARRTLPMQEATGLSLGCPIGGGRGGITGKAAANPNNDTAPLRLGDQQVGKAGGGNGQSRPLTANSPLSFGSALSMAPVMGSRVKTKRNSGPRHQKEAMRAREASKKAADQQPEPVLRGTPLESLELGEENATAKPTHSSAKAASGNLRRGSPKGQRFPALKNVSGEGLSRPDSGKQFTDVKFTTSGGTGNSSGNFSGQFDLMYPNEFSTSQASHSTTPLRISRRLYKPPDQNPSVVHRMRGVTPVSSQLILSESDDLRKPRKAQIQEALEDLGIHM